MNSDFYMENEFVIRNARRFATEFEEYGRKDVAHRAAKFLSEELNKLESTLENSMNLVSSDEESEIVMLAFKMKQIVCRLANVQKAVIEEVSEENQEEQQITITPEIPQLLPQVQKFEAISDDENENHGYSFEVYDCEFIEPKSQRDIKREKLRQVLDNLSKYKEMKYSIPRGKKIHFPSEEK